jgi:hypothetical protein
VPAWKARAVYFALLQEAGVIGDDAELTSFDKLIPDQDDLQGKKVGNLIALPFQGKAAQKGHTLFLDPQTGFIKPYADQWSLLGTAVKCSETDLDRLISEWRLKRHEARSGGNGNPPGWISEALNGVVEGSRDDTGAKLAGYFRRKRLPEDVILQLLLLWNERNKPPLQEHEVEKIAQSVSRYKYQETRNEFDGFRQCRALD